MNEDFDITGGVKVIEWLKTELLGAVTELHRLFLKGSKISQDALAECIAGIVILSYIMARRLGIEFSAVDLKVQNKLKVGIIEGDEIEKVHGDLSQLLSYIRERKIRT